MDNFENYLDEGTKKIRALIASKDLDENEKQAVVNAFAEELSSGIGKEDGFMDYDLLINTIFLRHNDEKLSDFLYGIELSDVDEKKAKILLEKQKRLIHLFQEHKWTQPQIVYTDPEQYIQDIEKQVEKRKKEKRRKRAKKLRKMIALTMFGWICILAVAIGCIYMYRSGKIQIPVDIAYATGMDFFTIQEEFESAGFTNVNVIAYSGGWEKSGSVLNVTVDGSETFRRGSYVEPDATVDIVYSSSNRVDISQYLDGWQNKDYRDMKEILENNKFSNVRVAAVDTLEKSQDLLTCGFDFNGENYTNGPCYLPLNSPIVIRYYTFKVGILNSNAQFVGRDCDEIVGALKENGFTNVQTEEIQTGWEKGNSVIAVLINGSASYDANQVFAPHTKIVVQYSSNDRVDMKNYFEDWPNTDYKQVQSALKKAGFTNVEVKPRAANNKENNQLIARLHLNGENYTGGDCFLQKSGSIVIEYYHLKIAVEKSASDYTQNTKGYYSEVVREMEKMGFTRVKVLRKDDLINGWITKEGSIDRITIDGREAFSAGNFFDYDDEVEIVVHTFQGKGCDDIIDVAKD